MSPARQDAYLERVKAEIRNEADLARVRDPLPRNDPPTVAAAPTLAPSSAGIERDRLDYPIGELTGPHYVAFVDAAFRALLKRAPDEAGMQAQVRLLASGGSKAEVLGNLRWSREGKHVGVRVHGLLPRYLLSKLARVRIVGYAVDWAIALAGLPMLLRHQRAADTSNAARFGELGDAQARGERALREHVDAAQTSLREHLDAVQTSMRGHLDAVQTSLRAEHETFRAESAARADEVRGGIRNVLQLALDLRDRIDVLEAGLGALERGVHETRQELGGVRHLAQAINHWVTSVQRSVEDLETTGNAERDRADAFAATVVAGASDQATRVDRHTHWASAMATRLPASGRVLDLGSGDGGWLAALVARGIDASGVESNLALVDIARAHVDTVEPGDPLATLQRIADASLDGISVDRAVLPEDDIGIAGLLDGIARTLTPAGVLLLRLEREPYRIASRATSDADARHWSAILVAAGFASATHLPGDGGSALLTQRP